LCNIVLKFFGMEGFNLFSGYLLPATLFIITLGMGLSIEARDFKNIFLYPKAVLTGLLSQMILLPVIAFLIATASHIDPVFKVGLILIAACPGGATSNLVNFMLNGNVALSISITIINSIITLFTIPLLVRTALLIFMERDAMIHLPYSETLVNLFIVVVIPAFTGVLIRHYYPGFAKRLERPLRYILPGILLTVYLGVLLIDESDEAAKLIDFINVLPYTFLLNLVSMLAGFGIGYATGLSNRNRFTIAVETGLQNSTLAIFIAATLLNDQVMSIVPIIYGSFSFFSTWLLGYMMKKMGRKKGMGSVEPG